MGVFMGGGGVFPRRVGALSAPVEVEVEARNDGELVGGERSKPIEAGQRPAVGLRIHVEQFACAGHEIADGTFRAPGLRVVERCHPAHVV